jgi:hypothetical protein
MGNRREEKGGSKKEERRKEVDETGWEIEGRRKVGRKRKREGRRKVKQDGK